MKLWTNLDVRHVVALVKVRPILSWSDAWSISSGSRTRVRKAQRRGAVKSDLIDFQHLSIFSETTGFYKSHNHQQSPTLHFWKSVLWTQKRLRVEGCSSAKTSQGTGGEDRDQKTLFHLVVDHVTPEDWMIGVQLNTQHLEVYYVLIKTIYHIIPYHIISYHTISYHIISYHIISCNIISYHLISYHIILHRIVSYRIVSYHIVLYHVIISYHLIWCDMIWYDRIWYDIISCDIR